MSQSSIFVVMARLGTYSEERSFPVRAFATRDEADRMCKVKAESVCFLQGIESAIAGLMTRYDDHHPRPIAPASLTTGLTYVSAERTAFDQADLQWCTAREEYENVLVEQTGCAKARQELFGMEFKDMFAEDAHWYVKDVPLGAE